MLPEYFPHEVARCQVQSRGEKEGEHEGVRGAGVGTGQQFMYQLLQCPGDYDTILVDKIGTPATGPVTVDTDTAASSAALTEHWLFQVTTLKALVKIQAVLRCSDMS